MLLYGVRYGFLYFHLIVGQPIFRNEYIEFDFLSFFVYDRRSFIEIGGTIYGKRDI